MLYLIAFLAAVASAGSLADDRKDDIHNKRNAPMYQAEMSDEEIQTCMTENKVSDYKRCNTHYMDSSDCDCDTTCQEIPQGNFCMRCNNFRDENTCTVLTDRNCMWVSGNPGKCYEGMKPLEFEEADSEELEVEMNKMEVEKKDASGCAELKGKKCKKNKMCKLEGKNCVQAFEDQCYGKIEDNHGFCYKHRTKEDCMGPEMCKKTPLGTTCKCEWGFNKHDREQDNRKCVEDTMGLGTMCKTDEDCGCGTFCYEMFGQGSCMICQDIVGDDCKSRDECKWVAGDLQNEEGICLRKDMCREQMEKSDCDKMPMCQYGGEGCTKRVMDKKGCKKMSGHKTKKSDEENTRMMRACTDEPNCKWSDKKKKCGVRK